eukprot:CAMPEP_0176375082 /NCGR_PEP_ID=MMETSP0126-20121128/27254_1 /TAXON_ID=141414 ORGANISM="Strombidinopsis acuminatum, Strain SPMC142" /NCGR_SAMPLE_ID=MMETSP0126 /ASSEMBLY_ACC=CAM_ASM_000229 /LENGTH=235 /DNA_ID=CAMNT_0017736007 /DNA_START=15 /DNA_END=722 /DNA_ORIENTATION=-
MKFAAGMLFAMSNATIEWVETVEPDQVETSDIGNGRWVSTYAIWVSAGTPEDEDEGWYQRGHGTYAGTSVDYELPVSGSEYATEYMIIQYDDEDVDEADETNTAAIQSVYFIAAEVASTDTDVWESVDITQADYAGDTLITDDDTDMFGDLSASNSAYRWVVESDVGPYEATDGSGTMPDTRVYRLMPEEGTDGTDVQITIGNTYRVGYIAYGYNDDATPYEFTYETFVGSDVNM